MAFKCRLCLSVINYDDLINKEWCCGRCTVDDWDQIKDTNSKEDNDILIDSKKWFSDLEY